MSEEVAMPSGESPAASALRRLSQAIDEVAALDLDAESQRELCEATVVLQTQCNRLDAQRLRLLDGVDRREAYREDACVTSASWLRWRSRLDHGTSTRLAQAARRRHQLSAMTAALEAGDITLAHLLAATAAGNTAQRLEAVAASDDTLAQLAKAASPREVTTAVVRIRDAVDADGSDPQPSHVDDQGRDRRRECDLRRVGDLGHLTAKLDAETSELLAALLDALSTPDPPGTPEDQRRSASQRRADAFAEIVRRASSTVGMPTVHGARPAATLTVDLATALGYDHFAAHAPRLRHLGDIPGDVARRILAKATVQVVATMGPWRITHVGRRFRTLPPWLRPCVESLHRHCRGPGCDRPFSWSQMCHQTDWADDGDTAVDETLPGCTAHHHLLSQGWTWTADHADGSVTWHGPNGQTIVLPNPNAPPQAA